LTSAAGCPYGHRVTSDHDKFQHAEQAEQLSAELYAELAKRFSGDSDLFRRLEAEELQHLQRVRMIRSRYNRERGVFDAITLDVEGLRTAVDKAQTKLAALRSGQELTLEQAKRWMLELEEALASAHADALIRTRDLALSQFFSQLAQQDKAHAELLTLSLEADPA